MYYSKNAPSKDYQVRRLSFDDFKNNIDTDSGEFCLNGGKMCYNLKEKNGFLKENWGFRELTLPKTQADSSTCTKKYTYANTYTFKKAWRYKYYSDFNNRYEYLMVYFGSDNYIYYNNTFSYNYVLHKLGNFAFNEMPVALNFKVSGKDVMGFCSPSDQMVVWNCDGVPYVASTVPKFKSICLHNNRLFAIDSAKEGVVRYSSQTNPLIWTSDDLDTGGGSMVINDYKGSLQSLVSFGDSVFVFRDFGLSKISAYSSSNTFTITNVYSSSSKIFANTHCVCGDCIFFLQEDGLYKFDGYSVKKIDFAFKRIFESFRQDDINTCFYDEKLYIACHLQFDDLVSDDHKNNAVVTYDLNTNEFEIIRGLEVVSMYALKELKLSKLVLCLNDSTYGYKVWEMCDGKDSESILPKCWESGKIAFETFDKDKILKEVNMVATKNCALTIESENQSKTLQVTGKSGLQRIAINVGGKYFSIKFSSSGSEFCVGSPQFVFKEEK